MIQKKVCMVGVYATGKTSLVRQFVDSKFSERYLSTVGVKIDRKPVKVVDQDVNLLLWDLEGRDEIEEIQTSYLKGAAGILYVVDGTRRATLDQIYELREIVERTTGPLPSAVAVNKADLTDQWVFLPQDEAALRRHPWHVFSTSARTGAGVEAAFLWLAATMVTRK